MKVFISWSGDYSKRLAEAIHWRLPNVLQFARPYSDASENSQISPSTIVRATRFAASGNDLFI
jgi:uncharacterized protein YerC